MKVIWNSRAENCKDQIADYICERFGARHMKKFRHSVDQTVRILKSHPNIGSIDPLFADRAETYRSVVVDDLSKMVYRYDEDEEIIHIVAFWDCRRDPSNESDRVK